MSRGQPWTRARECAGVGLPLDWGARLSPGRGGWLGQGPGHRWPPAACPPPLLPGSTRALARARPPSPGSDAADPENAVFQARVGPGMAVRRALSSDGRLWGIPGRAGSGRACPRQTVRRTGRLPQERSQAVGAGTGVPRFSRLSLRTLPGPGWGHRLHRRATAAAWAWAPQWAHLCVGVDGFRWQVAGARRRRPGKSVRFGAAGSSPVLLRSAMSLCPPVFLLLSFPSKLAVLSASAMLI